MAVPKRKKSRSRVRTKRAHHALSRPHLATCANCGSPKMPHRVCGNCGHYRGRTVLDLDE